MEKGEKSPAPATIGNHLSGMEQWLQPPVDRPANRSGRLCVLMAVTALLLMASPAVWAALPI